MLRGAIECFVLKVWALRMPKLFLVCGTLFSSNGSSCYVREFLKPIRTLILSMFLASEG